MDFLEQFKAHGFKDKSAIVRLALEKLRRELEEQALTTSADLYAEIYAEDEELRQLTESGIQDWPA
jgi:hypothetical protein